MEKNYLELKEKANKSMALRLKLWSDGWGDLYLKDRKVSPLLYDYYRFEPENEPLQKIMMLAWDLQSRKFKVVYEGIDLLSETLFKTAVFEPEIVGQKKGKLWAIPRDGKKELIMCGNLEFIIEDMIRIDEQEFCFSDQIFTCYEI